MLVDWGFLGEWEYEDRHS